MAFVFSAIIGAGSSAATNAANSAEAQRNRDFQERMSSTSFQRSRDDKIAAGINPILGLGSAPQPGGAQATQENPAEGLVASALQNKNLKQQQQKNESEISFNTAAEHAKTMEAASAAEQAKLTGQLTKQAEFQSRMQKEYGEVKEIMGLVNSGTQSLSNTAGAVTDLLGGKMLKKLGGKWGGPTGYNPNQKNAYDTWLKNNKTHLKGEKLP